MLSFSLIFRSNSLERGLIYQIYFILPTRLAHKSLELNLLVAPRFVMNHRPLSY